MIPVTVTIITKNEEDRIAAAIESVRGIADEIVVVDSGSDDQTVKIATSLGAKVVVNPFVGYGPQKRFAEDVATHDWILNIDADDRVSPDLVQELSALKASPKTLPKKAYAVRIKEVFVNQSSVPVFGKYNKRVRFYHKKQARFNDCAAHDLVVGASSSETGTLHGVIETHSLRSWTHALEKINAYSSTLAEVEFQKGKKPSAFKIFISPLAYLLKALFLKRYIFYGVEGYLQALSFMFLRMMKYAKTREKFLHAAQTQQPSPKPSAHDL